MENLAPIVVFVYRRLDHVKQVIEALKRNPEAKYSELIIFSDAGKDEKTQKEVETVRAYVKMLKGFASVQVIEREYNWGIEKSEIDGITKVVNQYGKIIVLEDDIIVGRDFLGFMNTALCEYQNEKRVSSITGYSFISSEECNRELPEYAFTQLTSAWGWGTWKDRWQFFEDKIYKKDFKILLNKAVRQKFDHGFVYSDMLVRQCVKGYVTWDILWYWTCFKKEMLTLFPVKTMVNNIGMDGTGVHYTDDAVQNRIEDLEVVHTNNFPKEIKEQKKVRQQIENVLDHVVSKDSECSFISFLRSAKKALLIYYCYWKLEE